MDSAPLTISDLADVLKGHLNGMGTLEVTGEISGYKTYPSGHHYFALKDSEAKVDCVLYSYQARWLKTPLRDGMKVVAKAKADFYGKTGKFSLIIESIKPAGEGDLFQKFKELQAKLKAEGLFEDELKRPLPEFPKVVAFVTSEIGAVWHDFIEVLKTRGWSGTAWLVPARVQGDTCPGSVISGLKQANEIPGIDLIVVGRGGGSMEDLWGFNDEALVRAVRASKTPVISAVGHQTDFTLCDFAADKRAETPTAAAELIATGQANNAGSDVHAAVHGVHRIVQPHVVRCKQHQRERADADARSNRKKALAHGLVVGNRPAEQRNQQHRRDLKNYEPLPPTCVTVKQEAVVLHVVLHSGGALIHPHDG